MARVVIENVDPADIAIDDSPVEGVLVTEYLEIHQEGALKNVALDLDEVDEQNNPIHFPITVILGDGLAEMYSTLSDLAGMLNLRHQQPELNPTPWVWNQRSNQFARQKVARKHTAPGGPIVEYAISAASRDLTLMDEILAVDEGGNPVSLLDENGRHLSPVQIRWPEFGGFFPSVGAFALAIAEQYPIYWPVESSRSNFTIGRLLIDGKWQEKIYRGAYGRDLPKSPRQVKINVERVGSTPEPAGPWQWHDSTRFSRKVGHRQQIAVVQGGNEELIQWQSGENEDHLPKVIFAEDSPMPGTVDGIHGSSTNPGMLSSRVGLGALEQAFPAANGEKSYADEPVIVLQASAVLWESE